MRSFILTPALSLLRPHELMTAEILYHLPDYPKLLQSFIWQDFDIAPNFPGLRRFLSYWEGNLDGKLHSVQVASREIQFPFEFGVAGVEFAIGGTAPETGGHLHI